MDALNLRYLRAALKKDLVVRGKRQQQLTSVGLVFLYDISQFSHPAYKVLLLLKCPLSR